MVWLGSTFYQLHKVRFHIYMTSLVDIEEQNIKNQNSYLGKDIFYIPENYSNMFHLWIYNYLLNTFVKAIQIIINMFALICCSQWFNLHIETYLKHIWQYNCIL